MGFLDMGSTRTHGCANGSRWITWAVYEEATVAAWLFSSEVGQEEVFRDREALQYMVTGADLTARLLLSWLDVTREASAILRCDRRVMRSQHVSMQLRPK